MRVSIQAIFLVLSICCSTQVSAETASPSKPPVYSRQDRKDSSFDNPLKGFSDFLFFPMIPVKSKRSADKLIEVVKSGLQKYGRVTASKILTRTEKGESIDLAPLSLGSTLIYQIEDLSTPQGKKIGVVRASLNFSTRVTVDKTKEVCSPYLWTANCFLKGRTDQHLDQLVTRSLEDLLEQFSVDFSAVNKGSPNFDLQGAE